MLSPKIIALEEGWNNEIKAKAIDVLEEMLNNGFDQKSQRLFAPKEYVQTCVAPRPALGRVAPSVRKGSFRARRPYRDTSAAARRPNDRVLRVRR